MEVEYIRNRVAGGIKALKKRIKGDVEEMCKVILIPLAKRYEIKTSSKELPEGLRGYFRDIYWSLKVHLVFHLGIADELQNSDKLLNEVGTWGGLTNEEMVEVPNPNQVVDPGSKLVDMVST